MYALAIVASFLVTPSLASPSIVARLTAACTYDGTLNQTNFTLLAISKTPLGIRIPLALGSNVSSSSTGWIGVSSLPLSATIVLIRHIFCRAQTL